MSGGGVASDKTAGAATISGRSLSYQLALFGGIAVLSAVLFAIGLLGGLEALALVVVVGVSLLAARAAHERDAEQKMRERAEAQNAAAESAARGKDFVLAAVSHELRGALTAVIGWLEIGRSHTADRATVGRAIDIALRSARQQARIIDDLVDVSRILAGRFAVERRPVELSRVVREALEAARPAAEEKQVELRLRLQEPLYVEGDRGRLLQAVGNLIGNALKFNFRGGWVEVVLESCGAEARLTVADNGPGIDGDSLAHLFERFWQQEAAAGERSRGLGLGLTLVRHIVELHGGRVSAQSAGSGQGARFTVEVPALADAGSSIAVEGRAREDGEPGLNGLGVVALDRNDDTLGWLQHLLAMNGAMTWKARTVEEALALADREGADVMISDVTALDERYELIKALRAASPERRVAALAFSSRPTEEDCQRALAAGYDGFVAKPCDAQVLLRAVRVAAQGRNR
jgi:signal transduction histidine kinase/CheY-like chemotaxis protein